MKSKKKIEIYDYDHKLGEKTYDEWLEWFSDYFMGAVPKNDLGIHNIFDLVEYINDQECDKRYYISYIF